MTWIVSSQIENPYGICLSADNGYEEIDYKPYTQFWDYGLGELWIEVVPGVGSYPRARYELRVNFVDQCRDYIRRTYNLPDDTNVSIYDSPIGNGLNRYNQQGVAEEFDTEAEALEYANSYDPFRYGRWRMFDGGVIFKAEFREQVSGVWFTRLVDFVYSGENITLYYLDDVINWYAAALGVSRDSFKYRYDYYPPDGGNSLTGDEAEAQWPGTGCIPRSTLTIIDSENTGSIPDETYVSLDFTPQIPDTSGITITVVDGDPTSKELINGDGSITIADNGNILMLNNGGTFFLNEFGNVGFYANGDASLTADNQVQLGVGQNSVTVENGSLTIRDSSGSATLTAAEINSLKDLLD